MPASVKSFIPTVVIRSFSEDFEQSKSIHRGAHRYHNSHVHLSYLLNISYKVSANKDDLSSDRLDEASVLVFGEPRERLKHTFKLHPFILKDSHVSKK